LFFCIGKQQINASSIKSILINEQVSTFQIIVEPKTPHKKAEFMLNDDEYQLIDFYLRKYKITNRSRLVPRNSFKSYFQKYGSGLSDSFQ